MSTDRQTQVLILGGAWAGLHAAIELENTLASDPAVNVMLNRGNLVEGEARDESVRLLLSGQRLAAQKLSDAARTYALQGPSADASWYRVDAIDRLSAEGSAIIAARLLHRVTDKVPLCDRKRHTLSAVIAEACRHELIDRSLTSAK
jgi:hypothetical protein